MHHLQQQGIGALKLYKMLLKEAKHFPQYNIREYFIRKVKRSFHQGKSCTREEDAQRLLQEGTSFLGLIKRQSVIYSQYHSPTPLQ